MREEVFPDSVRIVARAAAIVVESRAKTVAIASASIVRDVVRAAADTLAGVSVWAADDRCVPPDHPDSASGFAGALLPGFHSIDGNLEPGRAAEAYDAVVRAAMGEEPVFDLVILAAGGDGRVAGLFPGGPEVSERARIAVVGGRDHDGPRRVTLTLPVLNRARRTLIIASGADKAPMVARARDGDLMPAARVLGAEWLLDTAAATAPAPPRRRAGEPLEGQEVLFEL